MNWKHYKRTHELNKTQIASVILLEAITNLVILQLHIYVIRCRLCILETVITKL